MNDTVVIIEPVTTIAQQMPMPDGPMKPKITPSFPVGLKCGDCGKHVVTLLVPGINVRGKGGARVILDDSVIHPGSLVEIGDFRFALICGQCGSSWGPLTDEQITAVATNAASNQTRWIDLPPGRPAPQPGIAS